MSRLFSDAEIEFMRTHAKERTFAELTKMLNETFRRDHHVKQVKDACGNRGIKTGTPAGFQKGHKIGMGNKFNSGKRPHNASPAGTEVQCVDGYVKVKVSDNPPMWKHKHTAVWESINGTLPTGHFVLFADGNKQNFAIENLVLVTNAELAYLNRKGLIYNDTDLTKTALALTKLTLKINEKTRELGKGV